jgi:hypothetical protein
MKYTTRILASLLIVLAATFLGGCATSQLNADVSPGTKLSEVKKIYVVHLPKDGRGVDRLIADRLNLMGRQATSGEKTARPADADTVVTYQDKWMWDITMYMIELNIQLRHANTDMSFASGHSLRTSLVRKSPPEMVEEVLTEIFNKK